LRVVRVLSLALILGGVPYAALALIEPLHYRILPGINWERGLHLEVKTERWAWLPLPGPTSVYTLRDADGELIVRFNRYQQARLVSLLQHKGGHWIFVLPEDEGGPVRLILAADGTLRLDDRPPGG
jgi:hypothetical protein